MDWVRRGTSAIRATSFLVRQQFVVTQWKAGKKSCHSVVSSWIKNQQHKVEKLLQDFNHDFQCYEISKTIKFQHSWRALRTKKLHQENPAIYRARNHSRLFLFLSMDLLMKTKAENEEGFSIFSFNKSSWRLFIFHWISIRYLSLSPINER